MFIKKKSQLLSIISNKIIIILDKFEKFSNHMGYPLTSFLYTCILIVVMFYEIF